VVPQESAQLASQLAEPQEPPQLPRHVPSQLVLQVPPQLPAHEPPGPQLRAQLEPHPSSAPIEGISRPDLPAAIATALRLSRFVRVSPACNREQTLGLLARLFIS
jgi:hypothetical protein